MEYHKQGCALAAPGWHRQLTFALRAAGKNLLFSYTLKCWAPRISWLGTFGLLVNRLRPQPCISVPLWQVSLLKCRGRDGLGPHLRNCFENGRCSGRIAEKNSSARFSCGKDIFSLEINRLVGCIYESVQRWNKQKLQNTSRSAFSFLSSATYFSVMSEFCIMKIGSSKFNPKNTVFL